MMQRDVVAPLKKKLEQQPPPGGPAPQTEAVLGHFMVEEVLSSIEEKWGLLQ